MMALFSLLCVGHGLHIVVLFKYDAVEPFCENGYEISGSTNEDEFLYQF